MSNTFNKAFEEFVTERTAFGAGSEAIKDASYIELSTESTKVFHKIKSFLPEESKRLIHSYEELINAKENIYIEYIYRQGLKDGMRLAEILDIKIGKAEKKSILDTPIAHLDMSTRSCNALHRANINTLRDLSQIWPWEVKKLRGVSDVGYKEIGQMLIDYGLINSLDEPFIEGRQYLADNSERTDL